MPAEVEVRIKDGKVSIEVSGVDDASCADITRALEQDIGVVEEVQTKPEYYVELDHMEEHLFEGEE